MDLKEFLTALQMDISEDSDHSDPSSPELLFTKKVTDHMALIGMTYEEPHLCYYKAKVGNANVRLNGYALDDYAENIDLFVSLYGGFDTPTVLPDSKINEALTHCLRFLTSCVEGKLSKEINESHDAYALVLTLQQAYADLDQIRIYVMTDGMVKTKFYKSKEISRKNIKVEVVDIERLFNHIEDGAAREELAINFNETFDCSLPCLWVPPENGVDFEYGLAIFTGEMLRYLYDKFGSRVLQANVRSFLMERGKVNREISKTLREEPEYFMAYNNGLVIAADDVRFGKDKHGVDGINFMSGLQIVNGGQTTASMFFTKRKFPNTDLSSVRVAAKIIRLSEDPEGENFVGRVAKYANLQNAVRDSDLTSNHVIHVRFEEYADRTICPDGFTKWFYERSTGSYNVMLNRQAKTDAERRRLKEKYPTNKKVIKTDLAKFICAWKQHPHMVSLGGQKCFKFFMDEMVATKDFEVNSAQDFKEIIGIVVLFKGFEKIIRREFKAFQANIIAYTVALFVKQCGEKVNLLALWELQSLSPGLAEQVPLWARDILGHLEQTADGKMISEWGKKIACWNALSQISLEIDESKISEIIKN